MSKYFELIQPVVALGPVKFYSEIEVNCIKIKASQFVSVYNSNDMFKILEIGICLNHPTEESIIFVCQKVKTFLFDYHYLSHLIDTSGEYEYFSIISQNSTKFYPKTEHISIDGKAWLRLT